MLFLVWFKLGLSETMSQKQTFEAWTRESKEAPKVIPRERVKGLYKVAGKQELVALLDFDSHQALDEAISKLTLQGRLAIASNLRSPLVKRVPRKDWPKPTVKQLLD